MSARSSLILLILLDHQVFSVSSNVLHWFLIYFSPGPWKLCCSILISWTGRKLCCGGLWLPSSPFLTQSAVPAPERGMNLWGDVPFPSFLILLEEAFSIRGDGVLSAMHLQEVQCENNWTRDPRPGEVGRGDPLTLTGNMRNTAAGPSPAHRGCQKDFAWHRGVQKWKCWGWHLPSNSRQMWQGVRAEAPVLEAGYQNLDIGPKMEAWGP